MNHRVSVVIEKDQSGFNAAELNGIRRLVLDAHGVILEAWNEHCGTAA